MYNSTAWLLLAVAALVYFGIAHRVLDRMRMSRQAALGLLAVMIAGAFLPEVRLFPGVSVDPGGALVPLGVALYLLFTADDRGERRRATVAALWTAAVVYATDWFLPSDPGGGRSVLLDPLWAPILVAAVLGYAAGRSRRAAFIAATLGVVLVDLIGAAVNGLRGIPGAWIGIGGAGVFDAVVLAGVGAVALAETFGELREWWVRRRRGRRPEERVPGGVTGGQPAVPGGRPGAGIMEGPGRRQPVAAPGLGTSWLLALLAVAVVVLTASVGPRFQRPTGDEFFDEPMELREIGTERLLLVSARVMEVGDVWIDGQDTWYRIVRVDGATAYARSLLQPADGMPADLSVGIRRLAAGWDAMRPASWMPPGDGSGLVMQGGVFPLPAAPPGFTAAIFQKVVDPAPVRPRPRGKGLIGIYHTHNDESYLPTDGTASVDGRGGIHRVGDVLGRRLAQHGFRVVKSEALHLPHDRGAYRRSRRTAVKLLPKNPLVLLDVHRDATPPEFYREVVDGEPVAQVRLVVGRENPFRRTNLSFARRLKAEADRLYPGLVKGIYYGRGDYNQDLGPRTLLIEVGAHTNSRVLAERGAALFATVVDRTLDRERR